MKKTKHIPVSEFNPHSSIAPEEETSSDGFLTILRIHHIRDFPGDNYDVKVSDLPAGLENDDVIEITRNASFDGAFEAHTTLSIYRPTLETEEEREERMAEAAEREADRKRRRYERYLKLKNEFEP
jgi:hypothetical protein